MRTVKGETTKSLCPAQGSLAKHEMGAMCWGMHGCIILFCTPYCTSTKYLKIENNYGEMVRLKGCIPLDLRSRLHFRRGDLHRPVESMERLKIQIQSTKRSSTPFFSVHSVKCSSPNFRKFPSAELVSPTSYCPHFMYQPYQVPSSMEPLRVNNGHDLCLMWLAW